MKRFTNEFCKYIVILKIQIVACPAKADAKVKNNKLKIRSNYIEADFLYFVLFLRYLTSLITIEAFWPPNPKEFDNAAWICAFLAL